MTPAELWKHAARRIDALGLRERCLLLVSAAVLLLALADRCVLAPAIAEQKQLGDRLKREQAELAALRAQLAAGSRTDGDSPTARLRREIAQWQARQQTAESRIAGLDAPGTPSTTLPLLLERTLARHERLTLQKLATVAEAPSTASVSLMQPTGQPTGQPTPQPTAPASAAAALPGGLRWQGVDLAVSGSYADLVDYLAELERALPGLRWDGLKLTGSAAAPSALALRVYLVEVSR